MDALRLPNILPSNAPAVLPGEPRMLSRWRGECEAVAFPKAPTDEDTAPFTALVDGRSEEPSIDVDWRMGPRAEELDGFGDAPRPMAIVAVLLFRFVLSAKPAHSIDLASSD